MNRYISCITLFKQLLVLKLICRLHSDFLPDCDALLKTQLQSSILAAVLALAMALAMAWVMLYNIIAKSRRTGVLYVHILHLRTFSVFDCHLLEVQCI